LVAAALTATLISTNSLSPSLTRYPNTL
jgi:hypothetical protein